MGLWGIDGSEDFKREKTLSDISQVFRPADILWVQIEISESHQCRVIDCIKFKVL